MLKLSLVSQSCLTLCNFMDWSTPGFPIHHQLSELFQTYVRRISDAIQPSHPLSSPSLSSIFPSIKVFSSQLFASGGQSIGVSASASVLPVNIYSGLISFRIDWLDLLAVQGALKNLFQQNNLKASILQQSAFFMVQLSHPSMTTGKTIALTIQTFVGKVMSPPFNMLSRCVIAFLPRSKCLNFLAAVTICSDFGAQENKICHCFHVFPFPLIFAMKWWNWMPWS